MTDNVPNDPFEGRECPKLSLGIDSTLGNWRDLTASVFGEASAATKFWDDKIAAHEQGRDEWVVSDEQQTLYAVGRIHADWVTAEAKATVEAAAPKG